MLLAYGMLFISALLFISGIVHTCDTRHLDFEGVLALLVSAATLTIFLVIRGRKSDIALAEFLKTYAPNGSNDTAQFQGVSLTPDTELRQFFFVFSLIAFSLKIPSRYYLAKQESLFLPKAFSLLFSLLFGWWGIPWGPIYTFQAIWTSLTAGKRITLIELARETQQAESKEEECAEK